MKYEIHVKAIDRDGTRRPVNVLDLDERSFREFVVQALARHTKIDALKIASSRVRPVYRVYAKRAQPTQALDRFGYLDRPDDENDDDEYLDSAPYEAEGEDEDDQ